MTFTEWLTRRRVTLTPRGDLIGHLRHSQIEVDDIYGLLAHLWRRRAGPDAYRAARRLWREYARATRRPVW